jgi:hypothetical protein
MNPTYAELCRMADCAKSELSKRKWNYPRWVADGRMTQEKATYETAMMGKILAYLLAQADRVQTQPDLLE